jgi:predicted dehydrogenase
MKAAVVGIGKMGLLHTSILSTFPNVSVVALCDKSKLITRFAKKAFSEIQVIDSLEKLKDFELDLIYVTTPIPSHFKVLQSIYSNNISPNVFVEKTLAFSLDQAELVCKLAEKVNGLNMVGYERRYAVTFNKAFELIKEGAIGKLISFKAYAYSSDFLSLTDEKALKATTSRGGLLRDLCSHAIDLALWYFGDLTVISSQRITRDNSEFEESISFQVTAKDGLGGVLEGSWCKKGYRLPEIGLKIIGSKGIINVHDDEVSLQDNAGASKKWYRLNLNDNVGFLLGAPEYYRESKAFIDSIVSGHKAEPSFSSGLKVEKVIEQVKQQMN